MRINLAAMLLATAALPSLAIADPAAASRASADTKSARRTFNFNGGWRMTTGDVTGAQVPGFDDRGWQAVTLPNAFNEKEAFAKDIKDLSTGITWYRKHFRLPAGAKPGKALIEFEGVRQAAEVWVNGVSVGLSENGVMAFGVDATKALKAGADNIIAVRVDNDWKYRERATNQGFQWNNNNFNVNYGGITKNVRLHLTDTLYQTLPLFSGLGTTGAYVWADGFDVPAKSATIHAETQVRNEGAAPRSFAYRVTVRDRDGRQVGTFDGGAQTVTPGETKTIAAEGRLTGLEFWSWGYGYLYTVTTSLIENGKTVDAVDTVTGFRKTRFADGMVTLNDRVLQMKGYAQRTSNEWPAVGVSIPPWISDYSNALMVASNANLVRWMHVTPSKQDIESADRVGLIQAMPAGDAEGDVKERRWEQRKELMRDAIVYNRNNPSILFYESGNENISEAHMAEMKAIRDLYDPYGGRAAGSREMLDSKVAEYGGEMLYINKSAGKPLWATEYSRDEGARKFWDEQTAPFHKDGADYNRNMDSHAAQDVSRWWDYYRERPGSGKRTSAGGVNIIFSDSNTHHRGDNNYRRSGEVDAMRIPKQGFFAHQVMWDGWVDSDAPRTHIIGHWNYAAGTRKDVMVVSNGDAVELFVGDRSLGRGVKSDGFLFTFRDVAFAPGVLRAVSTYADGRRSEYRLETTGPAVALKLVPRTGPGGFRADGADLALVDVEVVDAQGRRVPTALDPVTFKLDGAAEWRGGIAQGPDNYILAQTLPVEGGINRVMLRATTKPGTARLTATAPGLKSASLRIPAVGVAAAKDGLSTMLPDRNVSGFLTRGPTPAGPSFRQWRRPIAVASIVAGSNGAETEKSVDDNELSAWSSDGTPAGAWIEYRFAKPEQVGELTFKMTGWRLRDYPVRITLDGKTIWEGRTPKALGYLTLPVTQAIGSKLRITMTGPTEDRDAFGKIVELNSERAAWSTGADKVKPGWRLSIIEAEIYAPVERPGVLARR